MRILIAALLFAALLVAKAEGPDDSYLAIFNSILEADALNDAGKSAPAAEKYREAKTALQQLQKANPTWNKKMIQYRLTYVTQKLETLSAAPATPPAVVPAPAPVIAKKEEPPTQSEAPHKPEATVPAPEAAPGISPPAPTTEEKSSFPSSLKILSRAGWKAKLPVSAMIPHTPKAITIHHTATKQNPKKSLAEKLRNLQTYSQREAPLDKGKTKPVWPDVLYHFYVAVDGEIGEGRDINFVGETNTDYDPSGHILVCLEGNFENEQPTEAQMKSTVELVNWLTEKYRVGPEGISGHKDHAKTACPGKNLYGQLDDIRRGRVTK